MLHLLCWFGALSLTGSPGLVGSRTASVQQKVEEKAARHELEGEEEPEEEDEEDEAVGQRHEIGRPAHTLLRAAGTPGRLAKGPA